ncbi:complement factor H-like [Bolinopsis microptera]|uniref:complement factor H-like n=1 Tax=Bolinopsis microptera TaxID=2820187 RepID=UPI003079BC3E
MPKCVLGDAVKLHRQASKPNMQLSLKEITIARRIDTEGDTKCCGKAPDWSNIEEMDQLPVKHGTQLSVSCKHGHRNVGGNSNIRCQDGIIIASEAPKCLASCKDESIIWDHVQVVDPYLPAEHGAPIRFSCVSGYNNFGGGTANCNDGKLVLIDGDPQCFADCRIYSLSKEVTSEPKLPVSHKTPLELSCFPGHTNLGGNSATCTDGDIVPTSEKPSCMADCDRDNLPSNSRTNHSMPIQHGTELSVSCKEGYSNSGGSEVVCENGLFNPQGNPPNCSRDCSTKSIVWENVTVDSRLSVEHGALITFTCVSGTSNFGVPHDCLLDSVLWDNTKTVPTLPVKDGERITIKCADGYRNNGSVTATCVNGTLKPSEKPTSCLPNWLLDCVRYPVSGSRDPMQEA